jgi:death-on-curing protein
LPTGKRRRHYRITEADALGANDRALLSGGRRGIRDWSQVLSAIARPYHGYHQTIAKKAAALLEGIAKSHGFIDGNKRTAIILTLLLIEHSGYSLGPVGDDDPERYLEDFTVDVVENRHDFVAMVDWFKARIAKK